MFINLHVSTQDSPGIVLDLLRSVQLRPVAFPEHQFVPSAPKPR